MLLPKKVKHRKWHRMRRNMDKITPETRGTTLAFGSFGLKSEGYARVTSNQIEAVRKTMQRNLGKVGRVWIRIFPDMPFTAKPPEVGMGKGKGDPQGYCFEVRPGRVIFEIDGADSALARESLRKAGTKLPLKTKVIARV